MHALRERIPCCAEKGGNHAACVEVCSSRLRGQKRTPFCSVPRKKSCLTQFPLENIHSYLIQATLTNNYWDYIQERTWYRCSAHPEAKSYEKAAHSHEVEGCITSAWDAAYSSCRGTRAPCLWWQHLSDCSCVTECMSSACVCEH